MDFELTQEQQAMVDMTGSILTDSAHSTEQSEGGWAESGFNVALWQQFAASGLTGLNVAAQYGGSDLDFLDLCLVIEELGKYLPRIPYLAGTVCMGMAVARFGSADQRGRVLPRLAAGDAIYTADLHGLAVLNSSLHCRYTRKQNDWVLKGRVHCVPYAGQATCMLLAASGEEDGEPAFFLLDPARHSLALASLETTSGEPQCHVDLDGVTLEHDDVLAYGAQGRELGEYLQMHSLTALAFYNLGVAQEALRRTAEYTGQRHQFGRALGSFQGVAMRAADAFIDVEALRVTCLQAAWRLSQELPAQAAVRAASWWACEAANRVVHTAQHLHGGVGADVSYPLHQYFQAERQCEVTIGGAARQLQRLGSTLRRERIRLTQR